MSKNSIVSDNVGDQQLKRNQEYYCLKADVEDFLYSEAELLDTRRFEDWLEVLADDIVYFMPVKQNVKFGQQDRENTKQGIGISWFDEGKWTLRKRVEQILTGVHYAEEPLSRVCHLVSNVQVLRSRNTEQGTEHDVRSRFLVYQNRVQYETYFFVGKRTDIIRETESGFKVARREIQLDQNVLLAKSLTTFF